MEACVKADQRNSPCIMLTVLFWFNYCLLLLLSWWVLIFFVTPYWVLIKSLFLIEIGSLLGPYFWPNGSFSLIGCTVRPLQIILTTGLLIVLSFFPDFETEILLPQKLFGECSSALLSSASFGLLFTHST